MAADDTIAQLERDYCPPLDAALLQAILSDFDLDDPNALSQARDILDPLRDSAAAEEAANDFDAAGVPQISPNTFSFEGKSDAADTELTSISNGFSKLGTDDEENPSPEVTELNSLDPETKAILLQELFPHVNSYTLKHTLSKCNSDWQRALDELLNNSFFSNGESSDGERVLHKSIDAFAEGNSQKRGRRKKRPLNKADRLLDDRRTQSASSLYTQPSPSVNKWNTANTDVDFIAKHANLSPALVKSAYYTNGASMPKTITSLLDDLMRSTAKLHIDNESVQMNAAELGRDFPLIKSTYLTALIQLTHPSTASAHELAKALTTRPSSNDSGPIVPQYTPVNLSDDEATSNATGHSTGRASLHLGAASELALKHREAHRQLSAQAQAAYKRSKSQKLMGGAAAYYSSVSRDHAASAAAYTSAAADALVASQSNTSQLDLHGVTVNDAVRIASRKTQEWWNRLGEAKANGRIGAEARLAGYRIVVGVGRHSEGGKGKIGPAVYNKLVGDGWTVDKGEGVLTVRGKGRK